MAAAVGGLATTWRPSFGRRRRLGTLQRILARVCARSSSHGMSSEHENPFVFTYYAPGERADEEQLRTARARFLADETAVAVLESMPDPVMVLNAQRQIVAANSRLLDMLGLSDWEGVFGLRPGEAAGCLQCAEAPAGCGTGTYCLTCGAVQAIVEALQTRGPVSRECRMRVHQGSGTAALDLLVRANYLSLDGIDLVIAVLHDIGAEKRRQVLERVFFHDVLNTVSKITSLTWLLNQGPLDAETEAEYKQYLHHFSLQVAEEIGAQRQLLAAERGELTVELAEVDPAAALEQVADSFRHDDVARGRTIEVKPSPAPVLRTDPGLLRRILGNLVKNALEATPEGETVTLSVENQGDEVAFRIHNPGSIDEIVQRQIFHRSFSTKPGEGRGIGTHSVKLFAEQYLGGKVEFTSTEEAGTVFVVRLPRGDGAS